MPTLQAKYYYTNIGGDIENIRLAADAVINNISYYFEALSEDWFIDDLSYDSDDKTGKVISHLALLMNMSNDNISVQGHVNLYVILLS
jgi:hypothetical protein